MWLQLFNSKIIQLSTNENFPIYQVFLQESGTAVTDKITSSLCDSPIVYRKTKGFHIDNSIEGQAPFMTA